MGEKIGFIGVGRMGSGMVGRLLAAGHTVTVHDPNAAAVAAAVARGARAAGSPPRSPPR
ncbi:MAG: NAD(P)-binding domain-containing protein [Steroidobacteraceae bacterium]